MRNIISTALLILLSNAVNAEGFYQTIVGNSPQAHQQVTSEPAKTHYTPLYKQVTASVKRLAAGETIGPRSEISYTPLYLQVVGPAKPGSVATRIAQADIN